ncbi:hypothetical protein TSAR_013746 [Trichomalopsis sarcophagae]|uniref:Uncharacterized protein n=1 Tax=Trichomalopsis sarcophagae TaxID=543379 RepID=A0A232FND9_9HYME|nr:hypothetical protein TSAR_013746 [Trichomalopsis sarcophagae]
MVEKSCIRSYVAKFREESYPKNLVVTETKCVVRLQQLLNYTIEPLFMCLNLSLYDKENTTLLLILKYGFDGMDVNAYRQKSDDQKNSFSSIFCCSMVPLRSLGKSSAIIVISSNCLVNNEAFGAYCKETAFKYVELYNWYKMPTSMHVMEELILPIGMLNLTEDVAKCTEESYPKDLVVTETKCVVRLQQLLNNTIERLFMFLYLSFYLKENTTLLLILKYGFDGTNVNAYRQKSDDQKN